MPPLMNPQPPAPECSPHQMVHEHVGGSKAIFGPANVADRRVIAEQRLDRVRASNQRLK